MTRFLSSIWALVSALLLGRAFAAQASWESVLQRLGRPHEYQTAALVMAVVGLLALAVTVTIAMRSRALTGYPIITITGLLFIYAVLMLALGMHRYEPAFATLSVVTLLFASSATCLSAAVLRLRRQREA